MLAVILEKVIAGTDETRCGSFSFHSGMERRLGEECYFVFDSSS